MNLDEYKRRYEGTDVAPGWDAIDAKLKQVYPNQQPKHYAAVPHYALGGDDPIDGISIYRSKAGGVEHFHFVTYGFSQLYYDETAFGGEFSKFGFELTFRLILCSDDDGIPFWAMHMLQNIARYVFKSGKWFERYHIMPAGGPIRQDTDTAIRAILFVPDPELGCIQSPHGQVEFLQIFGITQAEYEDTGALLPKTEALAETHRQTNPYFLLILSAVKAEECLRSRNIGF